MLDQPTFASKKKKKNLDIDLHLSQKLTQWIIDINVRHKTTKLEDNIGEN